MHCAQKGCICYASNRNNVAQNEIDKLALVEEALSSIASIVLDELQARLTREAFSRANKKVC